ncbi:MAG: hypothetical protein IJ072_04530 [Oscillospiraceae bacterium]|nr:hypothetical protein [Oscillospiraceae bacterium]
MQLNPGPIQEDADIREAVCIHTRKIFDSCRDKDCMEDLRFYPTEQSRSIIDQALGIRARDAKLMYTAIDVNEIAFNRGYYTVDIRYFYNVSADVFLTAGKTESATGLCVFDKRVILFGSEGSARVFSSDMGTPAAETLMDSNLPRVVVEAVDPIVLNMRMVDAACPVAGDLGIPDIPEFISCSLGSPVVTDYGEKLVYATLGQFSIIRLERDSQLLVPVYDYCMPDKECEGPVDDDPCAMFSRINFPVDEFFPPDTIVNDENYRNAKANLPNG